MILLETSVVLTDQGIIAFIMALIVIFGVMFGLIRSEAGKLQAFREDFIEFRADTRASFRLINVHTGETKRVGISNALDVLSEPNPWTQHELSIRDRMHRNPDINDEKEFPDADLLTLIRRLDAEIKEGRIYGDKLMAAHYMLRTLNGELAARNERRNTPRHTPSYKPKKPGGLRWLLGR